MEPIPETREVLRALSDTSDRDLLHPMQRQAERVVSLVPGCIGLSISLLEDGLSFTWLATADRIRVLDAAQFLDGGPCQDAAYQGDEIVVPDFLDEERWRVLAAAAAAQGVRSSLSMPLRGPEGIMGSINLYGSEPSTFEGSERRLAEMFGADVEAAVTNADLSMASLRRAEHSVEILRERDKVDIAVGILAHREHITVVEARRRLEQAALRANTPVEDIADLVVASEGDRS